jgi:hypothetical protein
VELHQVALSVSYPRLPLRSVHPPALEMVCAISMLDAKMYIPSHELCKDNKAAIDQSGKLPF